ncbi:MAG TPA: hypoxanthine-guanine phosphoribosyltransferase, partial [Pseudomonas sp.]|nr:hypoxanthine-guanine phosphoribosyltransferase [Pseudomonas sp.]
MSANLEHIQQVMAEADILFTAEQVQAAVDQVAEQINQ